MIGKVGPSYFGFKPGSSRFDVDMPYSQVFDLPLGAGLELVAIVGTYGVEPKRRPLSHMIDEFDSCLLAIVLVDPPGSDPSHIIGSRILESLHLLSTRFLGCQELNIDLYAMSRDLLLVTLIVQTSSLWSQMASCSRVNDPILNLRGYSQSRLLRTKPEIDQPLFSKLLGQLVPAVKGLPSNSELATCQ